MKATDTKEFFDAWDQCAELYGKSVSEPAKEMAFKLLAKYDLVQIKVALKSHMLDPENGRFMPKPADVVGKIQAISTNGFPGAQQAWAQFPRDESQSACICGEMAVAWGIACELDEISGRMAFMEAYRREVDAAKAMGNPPQWFVTAGSDKDQLERVTVDAVRNLKLSPIAAQAYLPHIAVSELTRLAGGEITTTKLLDNHAQTVTDVGQLLLSHESSVDPDAAKAHIENMRSILAGAA